MITHAIGHFLKMVDEVFKQMFPSHLLNEKSQFQRRRVFQLLLGLSFMRNSP